MPANTAKMIPIFGEYTPLVVKYKDIFDLKEFYTALHEWLSEYGWKDLEDGFDHWETVYNEKVAQGGVKELWIQWRVKKPAPEASNLDYYLSITYHCLGLAITEVVKEGMKIKVNKGEMELKVRAFIDDKYAKDLESHSFIKYFKELFYKRVYEREIEIRKKELYQEVYAMQNFIKQWFKLKRYLPYEETKNFFTSYAWPSHLKE